MEDKIEIKTDDNKTVIVQTVHTKINTDASGEDVVKMCADKIQYEYGIRKKYLTRLVVRFTVIQTILQIVSFIAPCEIARAYISAMGTDDSTEIFATVLLGCLLMHVAFGMLCHLVTERPLPDFTNLFDVKADINTKVLNEVMDYPFITLILSISMFLWSASKIASTVPQIMTMIITGSLIIGKGVGTYAEYKKAEYMTVRRKCIESSENLKITVDDIANAVEKNQDFAYTDEYFDFMVQIPKESLMLLNAFKTTKTEDKENGNV